MLVFFFVATTHRGSRPPRCRGFKITHNHTYTHPVGLLCTSDQHVAEDTAYSTHTRENVRAVSGIRAHDPSSRAAADLRLRPHGRRYQLVPHYKYVKVVAYK